MTKLTKPQKTLITRQLVVDHGSPWVTVYDGVEGEPFILLCTIYDDRIAKNLSDKGVGCFVNNGWRYPWRKRSGYTNSFEPNAKGLELIKELKS